MTVQIDRDLIVFNTSKNPTTLVQYSGLAIGQLLITKRSKPPTRRISPGIAASHGNELIFVTGGQFSDTVDVYSLEKDAWARGPSLNSVRSGHSCCALGSAIYAFGGWYSYGELLD